MTVFRVLVQAALLAVPTCLAHHRYMQEQLFKEHQMSPPANLLLFMDGLKTAVPQRPGDLVSLDVDDGEDAAGSEQELVSEDETNDDSVPVNTTATTSSRAARLQKRKTTAQGPSRRPVSDAAHGSAPCADESDHLNKGLSRRVISAEVTAHSNSATQVEATTADESSAQVGPESECRAHHVPSRLQLLDSVTPSPWTQHL